MRTKQTEPAFLTTFINSVEYAASNSISLPLLPEVNDTVSVKMVVKGNGSAMALSLGAFTVDTGTIANGQNVIWDYTITNIGSGEYMVLGFWGEISGTVTPFAMSDTVNSYDTTNVTASLSNTYATGKYAIAGY